jgi:hypothetical protein
LTDKAHQYIFAPAISTANELDRAKWTFGCSDLIDRLTSESDVEAIEAARGESEDETEFNARPIGISYHVVQFSNRIGSISETPENSKT